MYRIRDAFTSFKEKFQSTWMNFFSDADVEKGELETIEEKECSVEGVQLRSRSGVTSKEWSRRLTDHQFLCGKDEEFPKRQTNSSNRATRNQRATVMVPQITRRSSDLGYRCSRCQMVAHRCCLNGVQLCEGRVHHELPVTPPKTPIVLYPSCGNLHLLKFPWWVENMTREEATKRLILLTNGTFLIRWSDHLQNLVLSLKVSHDVIHIKVLTNKEGTSFTLSEVHHFRTIEALVNYYQQNSLSECFSNLFSVLVRPIYDTAVARFPYHGSGANYLSLEPRDKVIIISHDGESSGWWKGRIGDRVGYFPKEFVQVDNNFIIV